MKKSTALLNLGIALVVAIPAVYKVYTATKDVFDFEEEIKEGLNSIEIKMIDAKKFIEDNEETIVSVVKNNIRKNPTFEIPDLEKF